VAILQSTPFMRPPLLPIFLSLTVPAMALAAPAGATSESLEKLTANSPFAPVQGGNATGETASLEFRGVFTDQGELFFSLFDPVAKTSVWVGLNEPGHAFAVRSYDPNALTINADHKGRSLTLALKKGPIVATASDLTLPGMGPTSPGSPAVNPVASSDDARRLANIAAEIRRRRAMRQQVASPTNAAPPPSPRP
jgi:hypothetical protein